MIILEGIKMSETNVCFRRANFNDLVSMIKLLKDDSLGQFREDYPTEILDERYQRAFAAIDQDPNQLLVVGILEGDVIATAQLTFIPGLSRFGAWRGQIEGVRVASKFRGRGIGHAMINDLVDRCQKRGCSLVQLTSDKSRERAHSFYEQLGFKASHEGFKRAI